MITQNLPDYILVGHAASVVFAAKNTIRMAALTGRVRHKQTPWGMVVSTHDIAEHYVLKTGFGRAGQKVTYTFPVNSPVEE